MKPRVFVGSSSEGLDVARAVHEHLEGLAEATVWKDDVFALTKGTLQSLTEALASFEFAILVVTPDDIRIKRGDEELTPRDNVIFEMGLFLGHLGADRTFVVADPRAVALPSDLLGMTVASYDSARSDGNLVAAVGPACSKVARAIKSAPRIQAASEVTAQRTSFFDDEALFDAVARWPIPNSGVVIQTQDTKWAWKLFPTILSWRLSGTPVSIFSPPAIGDERARRQEDYRRSLLQDLGARFTESTDLNVQGFFLDVDNPYEGAAFVMTPGRAEYEPLAISYSGKEHSIAATALRRLLPAVPRESGSFIPSFEARPASLVIDILKRDVHQYASLGVTIDEAEVDTSSLHLISPFTRAYKYMQIRGLHGIYEAANVQPFTTAAVSRREGGESVVTPPVVEIHEGVPVVIEGNTRASFAHLSKQRKFYCLRVNGVRQPLPGKPVPIQQMGIAERYLAPSDRIDGFDYGSFRHIERAVHPY